MASGLSRGAYSGRETKLYYNSGTHAVPAWTEIPRGKNIQVNDGPALSEIEFHGASSTGNIPGYDKFSGSYEYVRKRGTDAVYAALKSARRNKNIVVLRHLNQDISVSGAEGWDAPVLLGESASTANGGEGVMETFPFGKADAFDSNGDSVEVEDVVIA